ncbi:hypothetical protein niasHS_009782 [Heterodera schachtii]|uniref:Uncharacterized protein n=1 Tax=Heterodera schachtii TaxID=97005 RepID=A0ABD2IWK6_HETSC
MVSACYDVKSSLGKVRDCFQDTFLLCFVIFLIICAFPMVKLARERLTLYIMVSKFCPTIMMCFVRILLSPIVLYGFNVPVVARPLITQWLQTVPMLCSSHFIMHKKSQKSGWINLSIC